MKLTFVGADHQVTGSCHYIQACGKNILVDCGMQQGINPYACCDIPVDEAKLDIYDGGIGRSVFDHAS